LRSVLGRSATSSFFLFACLTMFSVGFFVMADDTVTKNTIFQDSDLDGLSNDEEVLYKTDPLNKDTDGDGYTDGIEVESGYDPTKPAPGDKLIPDSMDREQSESSKTSADRTLTDQVSEQIASMVQDETKGEVRDVSVEDINTAVQDIMSQSDQEVILPEIDMTAIKIKKVSDKLKGDKRLEQEKEDSVEYLTVMAYVLANNFPKKFRTQSDFGTILTSFGTESLAAVTLGNDQYLEDLAKSGQKILDETKDIEVPEAMIDVHVKAIKMAQYSMTLKDEVSTNKESDPMGTIASLSKVQGFFGVVADFSQEIFGRLDELGIKEIPISL
jgi:Bacterial TSP3 repeat